MLKYGINIVMSEITTNKRLLYDYEILDKWEAGIKLTGNEVKAVKAGRIDLSGAYLGVRLNPKNRQPEVWLIGSTIAKYTKAGYAQTNYQIKQDRKLLLTKHEINIINGKLNQKGLTLLPLSVYTTSHRLIKITIVLAKGKRKFDKREAIKKREFERKKQKLIR